MKPGWLVTMVLSAIVLGATGLLSAPQPSLSPKSWELKFEFEHPRQILITLPGEKKPRLYWYMLYTVTNNTGRDVEFFPAFDLLTDTLELVPDNVGVRSVVFDEIKKLQKRPLLERPEDVAGRLLQGEDNARESVAIWRDFDPKADGFKIFVSGLSGETVTIHVPGIDEPVVLRKTLVLEYKLPGDQFDRQQDRPLYQGRTWVMR